MEWDGRAGRGSTTPRVLLATAAAEFGRAATTRCTSCRSASTFRSAKRCRSCSGSRLTSTTTRAGPGENWTRFPLAAADGRTLHLRLPHLLRGLRPVPGAAVRRRASRVDFLVNISNDGWFDGTEEHEEHLAICRFRAVEAGAAIVRAVNMGISAVIDPDGRVVALPRRRGRRRRRWKASCPRVVPLDTRGLALRPARRLDPGRVLGRAAGRSGGKHAEEVATECLTANLFTLVAQASRLCKLGTGETPVPPVN